MFGTSKGFAGVRILKGTDYALTNNLETQIPWSVASGDIMMYDTHGFYNPLKNDRLTVPNGMAGIYGVFWGVEIAYNSTSPTQRRIYAIAYNATGSTESIIGGQSTEGPVTSNLHYAGVGKFGPIYMSDGDFVVLKALQNTGVTRNIFGGYPYRTFINMVRMSS